MQAFKPEQLKCCSFDASPESEWLITAHLERIWNHHFGALDCHMSYHNLMKQTHASLQNGAFEMLQF